MKVLLVANTDWYLYNFRRSLADYLTQRGYEVKMVAPAGKYKDLITKMNYTFIDWQVGRQSTNPMREFKYAAQLWKIYRREKPDIVQHFTIKPVLYGSLIARLLKIPFMINCITGLGYIFKANEPRALLLRPLAQTLYKIALSGSNCRVIFENGADEQYFLERKMVEAFRGEVINGVGVDTDWFQPAPEPEGVPRIVFPARMLRDKGVGTLIEAARLLKARVEVEIILVGQPDAGNPTSIDESTIKLWENEKLIEYKGWQNNMLEIFQNSHIVTLPSLYEGVPTALLEAAACGKPIVASDIPGCRIVVHHGVNGLLVPTNDARALADALETLVKDKDLRHQMGAASRSLAETEFTDKLINKKTYQVYLDLLGPNYLYSERGG
jgi:glycosyltransferase involved in cell wall biosynthesis